MTDLKQEKYEDVEVIEDARTGEEIPTGIQKVQSNTLTTSLDLTKVGTTVLDEKAEAVLNEPIKPEEVSIRPDGLVYLPWTWYADRLNRAFGRLGWGLVPQSGPMKQDMGNNILVVWGHWMVVRGIPVGYEIGECAYNPTNHTMSFGDASAGAKSNSLARNCKMLGMSLELWNQEWIEDWKEKYAERVKNPKGNRPEYIWRKKKANGQQPQPEQKATEPAKAKSGEPEVKVYTLAELKTVRNISQLATDADMKNSEVAVALGKFDKNASYHWTEIVEKLMEGK
jgi:hypothetical protein